MIVGIDPSLSCTALAIYHGGKVRVTLLKTKPGARDCDRIAWISDEVAKFLTVWKITSAGIESPSYGSQNAASARLIGLQHDLRWTLRAAKVPWTDVSPGSLKVFVTDSGRAQKADMIAKVRKVFPYLPKEDNAADATGLLCAQIELMGGTSPMAGHTFARGLNSLERPTIGKL